MFQNKSKKKCLSWLVCGAVVFLLLFFSFACDDDDDDNNDAATDDDNNDATTDDDDNDATPGEPIGPGSAALAWLNGVVIVGGAKHAEVDSPWTADVWKLSRGQWLNIFSSENYFADELSGTSLTDLWFFLHRDSEEPFSVLRHYDGDDRWHIVKTFRDYGGIDAMHGRSPTDTYFVGRESLNTYDPNYLTYIYHWDGAEFSKVYLVPKIFGTLFLQNIWVAENGDVFAAGHDFLVSYRNGRWRTGGYGAQFWPGRINISSIFGYAADDVYVAGSFKVDEIGEPLLLRFDGGQWNRVDLPEPFVQGKGIRKVVGTADGALVFDLWSEQKPGGTIVRCQDGDCTDLNWPGLTVSTNLSISGLWADDEGHVLLSHGRLNGLHVYDGESWSWLHGPRFYHGFVVFPADD